MKLVISQRAEKELKRRSKFHQIAIAKKIRSIRNIHQDSEKEKLTRYKNIFRVRVGQYRIVYRELADEIFIILVGHRRDIYRLLSQLFK